MAGYKDTRQLIIDTLMNRPAGTEIQPENHQEFALAITDYVRSVELLAGNAFIGFAEANTVPVQSDKGQCFYISTVGPGQTVNFVNFIDSDGNVISVSSPGGKMSLVTLIWNTQYWSSQIVTMDTNWSISQQSGSSELMVMSQKAITDELNKKVGNGVLAQTTDIASGAITGPKIAENSITTSNIVDGTIQSTDINSNAFDSTLKNAGKLADAKAVGDAINKLKNAGYLYAGIATPSTNPGTPDGPVFYIASQAGTYSNFGNTEIDNTGIFTWGGTSWSFEKLDFTVNDLISVKHGTFADALDAILSSNSVFEWMLVDKVDSGELIKPLWHVNGSLVDAAGAVVSLATLTAPVFNRDSGDVYVGTTVTITCPSGSTLYYSVNGVVATSTTDVTITINEASVVKAYLKSGDAVSDIVAKSYGIAVDHKFQFKIKLTGDNSTEYVPVVASGSPIYTMTVDWGDGSTPSEYNKYFDLKGCGHTYSGKAGDEFVITIRGTAIPYLAFGAQLSCNIGALVAILDNTLKCQTNFSSGQSSEIGGFRGCANLESLSANALSNNYGSPNISFQGTKLTSLPTGFFANLPNLNGCSNMFDGTSIILTAENILELKTAIKNVTNFSSVFYGFKGSVTLPDDFFDSVTATITNLWAFSHTAKAASISGDAKALYDVLVQKVSQSANTQFCFSCTGFSNRNQVPNSWGGTAG